jgi:phosphoribosylanthranilate isomerase
MEPVVTTVRVKICGITRQRDLEVAVEAGADAVGLVFAPKSKRLIGTGAAAKLADSVPAFVSRVGLFMDQDADDVRSTLRDVRLSLLQFHGEEDAAYCRQFGLPYLKAVSMTSPDALAEAAAEYADAAGLLLDSHSPGGLGGTGMAFDWALVQAVSLPLVLAGGLSAKNVGEAVRVVQPWAVDVSSGVEVSPGIKSAEMIREFIREAKRER